MSKRRRIAILGLFALILTSVLGVGLGARMRVNRPKPYWLLPCRSGQVKRFDLLDTRGVRHSVAEWTRGGTSQTQGIVLFFLAPDCPASDAEIPHVRQLAAQYQKRGILFYAVHAWPGVRREAAARHAEDHGLDFPVVLDPTQTLARTAGVERVPEAVLLATDGQILYGGRLNGLDPALEAVVHDEMPVITNTVSRGCPLPLPSVSDLAGDGGELGEGSIARAPSYCRDVAPILWKNCVICHRPGEVGPFSLLTYRDAAKRAGFLAEITDSGRMPPWKAHLGAGVFLDTLRLDDRERTTLRQWAEAGAPEGDLSDLPESPKFVDGWQIGRPDYAYTVAEPFPIPADGPDLYRSYVIPLPLERDQQIVGFEFRPGNRRVVHHAKLFVVPPGSKLDSGSLRDRDAADPGPGFASSGSADLGQPAIWEWTPGTIPRPFPEGAGKRIKSGSEVVLFIHYHPTGKPESDRSTIGIFLNQRPIQRWITGIPMGTTDIDIPAGAKRHRVVVRATLPADAHAFTLMPHAHLLLREMTLTVTRPDGGTQRLLWIDDWDLNWQGQYHFVRPVPLPKGTVIELVGIYDNSADNPRNPNSPPRRVRFGPASTDEMIGCHIQVIPDRVEDFRLFRKKWPQGL